MVTSRGRYQPSEHHAAINELLLECASRRVRKAMIFMPPRHGKSTTASINTPAWWLGTFPDEDVMLASHDGDLARQFGRQSRDILEEWGQEIWGVQVMRKSSAANRWDLAPPFNGGMRTAGIGGSITGRGAHFLVIDDPVKDAKAARSPTVQLEAIEWYRSTAYPRLEADGVVLVMMTRWHTNDLAGILLREEGKVEEGGLWTVLELPAIAVDDAPDALGRAPGEALWPSRWPVEVLLDRKVSVQPFWWAAEYQQRPIPEAGGIFKREWLRRYYENVEGNELFFYLDGPEHSGGARRFSEGECWRFATVDLATSLATTADYTVVAVWIVTPDGDLLLERVYRDRIEGPDQVPLLWEVQRRHRLSLIGIEKVGYQLSLVQEAVRSGLPAVELSGREHPEDRAIPAAAKMQQGRFFVNATMPYRDEYEEEILMFPSAAHDDRVTVTSYAAKMMLEYGVGRRVGRAAEGGEEFGSVGADPYPRAGRRPGVIPGGA